MNLAFGAGFGTSINGNDPLLIDLDGDGIELTRERNSDVHFDFDADGFAEHTAWVKPDDGIVEYLRNAANDNSPQMRIMKTRNTHG